MATAMGVRSAAFVAAQISAMGVTEMRSVSYTHLDVYKRQDQIRKGAALNAVQIAQLLLP